MKYQIELIFSGEIYDKISSDSYFGKMSSFNELISFKKSPDKNRGFFL